MKTLLKILVAIGNFFWGAFVGFKVYGWFAPETGLELPVLTYLNIVALSFVIGTLFRSTESSLKQHFIFEATADEDKQDGKFIGILTVYYGLALGIAYLMYVILF